MRRLLVWMQIAFTAILLGAVLFACKRPDQQSATPTEKVTIAYSATTDAVLAVVAHSRGYYREKGLEVDPLMHSRPDRGQSER